MGEILLEMKEGQRAILRELLRGLERPPANRKLDGIVVYLVAGLEGLALEWIERGDTAPLRAARELFVHGGRGDRAELSGPRGGVIG